MYSKMGQTLDRFRIYDISAPFEWPGLDRPRTHPEWENIVTSPYESLYLD